MGNRNTPKDRCLKMVQFPEDNSLSINILSQIFNDTTNSYKLMFFGALLNKVVTINSRTFARIPLSELADEMLLQAWFPSVFCHLSFGPQDQIAKKIAQLKFSRNAQAYNRVSFEESLKHSISEQREKIQIDNLLRYVPYRLLSPFFSQELRGLKDGEKNSKIYKLAAKEFNIKKPLYKFDETQSCIDIHPNWLEYLINNYGVIKGWYNWQWCKYLQSKNPNAPAILEKAFPPAKRVSLTRQTNFWKRIMQEVEVKCIYSGEQLNDKEFALDHYLPWSFVGHNQAWNLEPVKPSANQAKNNSLPHKLYFQSFIKIQFSGLQTMKATNQSNLIEDYITGLKITYKDLRNESLIKTAYTKTVEPLEIIAKRMGAEQIPEIIKRAERK